MPVLEASHATLHLYSLNSIVIQPYCLPFMRPQALAAFTRLSRQEGIIPALETSHAIAYLEELCPTLAHGTRVVINCSGRGDKDVNTAIKALGM